MILRLLLCIIVALAVAAYVVVKVLPPELVERLSDRAAAL